MNRLCVNCEPLACRKLRQLLKPFTNQWQPSITGASSAPSHFQLWILKDSEPRSFLWKATAQPPQALIWFDFFLNIYMRYTLLLPWQPLKSVMGTWVNKNGSRFILGVPVYPCRQYFNLHGEAKWFSFPFVDTVQLSRKNLFWRRVYGDIIGDVLKTCLECIVVTIKGLDGKILN